MTDMVDLPAIWISATDEVAEGIASAQQRAYLRLTRLFALVEDTALVSVPDAFTRDVIETRMRPAITEPLSRRLGRPVQVAVTVRPPDDGSAPSSPAPAGATGLAVGHPGTSQQPDTLFDAAAFSAPANPPPRPDNGWLFERSGSAVAEHPVDASDRRSAHHLSADRHVPVETDHNRAGRADADPGYRAATYPAYPTGNVGAGNVGGGGLTPPQRAGAGTGRDDRRPQPNSEGNRLNPKYM